MWKLLAILYLLSLTTLVGADDHHYYLTVATIGAGHVYNNPPTNNSDALGDRLYLSGTTVALVAVADPGWKFDTWKGNCKFPTASMCSVTLDNSKNVIAWFVKTTELTP